MTHEKPRGISCKHAETQSAVTENSAESLELGSEEEHGSQLAQWAARKVAAAPGGAQAGSVTCGATNRRMTRSDPAHQPIRSSARTLASRRPAHETVRSTHTVRRMKHLAAHAPPRQRSPQRPTGCECGRGRRARWRPGGAVRPAGRPERGDGGAKVMLSRGVSEPARCSRALALFQAAGARGSPSGGFGGVCPPLKGFRQGPQRRKTTGGLGMLTLSSTLKREGSATT